MKKMLLIALSLAPVSVFSHEAETEVVASDVVVDNVVTALRTLKKCFTGCQDLKECCERNEEAVKALAVCLDSGMPEADVLKFLQEEVVAEVEQA